MSTVAHDPAIYTLRHARKTYTCDGPHDTYAADPLIRPGTPYFRASLPPWGDIGYGHWQTARLCWTCAPYELTCEVIASSTDEVPF